MIIKSVSSRHLSRTLKNLHLVDYQLQVYKGKKAEFAQGDVSSVSPSSQQKIKLILHEKENEVDKKSRTSFKEGLTKLTFVRRFPQNNKATTKD